MQIVLLNGCVGKAAAHPYGNDNCIVLALYSTTLTEIMDVHHKRDNYTKKYVIVPYGIARLQIT
jgi:hypothetical protein